MVTVGGTIWDAPARRNAVHEPSLRPREDSQSRDEDCFDSDSLRCGQKPLHIVPQLEPGRGLVLTSTIVLLIFRISYLCLCPLELVPDEAYYWDWSRFPDLSYSSKPQMVAWIIALATLFEPSTEIAIRVPAALLGTVGQWMVYELARRLYGHRAAVWAFTIIATSPGMMALCLLMTIDAPFLLLWTVSIYCLWRMFEFDRTDSRWLLPAIAATGAGLLTKQTTLGVFPLTILFLSLNSIDRCRLKSLPFWIWISGSSLFLIPVVVWNWRHDWITFKHTLNHFNPGSASLVQHLLMFLEFGMTQFGLLSPIIAGFVALTATVLTIRIRSLPKRERFLICFGGLPAFAVALLSAFQRVQPNWAVALHLASVILVSAWYCGHFSLSRKLDSTRQWIPHGVALGAILSMAIALVPFLIPGSSMAGSNLDPTVRLRGWREMCQQASTRIESLKSERELIIIAATARGPVSELAFYLPGQPRVYRWNMGGVVDSQHDIWGGPLDAIGRDALIVMDDEPVIPRQLADAFTSVEELDPIIVSLGPTKRRRYRIWRGIHLNAWPVSRSSASLKAVRLQNSSQQSR